MRSRWFGLVIVVLAVAVSIWAYPELPPTVATHWGVRGTADGFSSKGVAVLIMPAVILVLTGLFNVLPRLDPRRANYARFIGTYWLIVNAVILFILVGHGMIIANGLGYTVQVGRFMPIGVGLLFVVLGNYLTRVEPNWFVGIRTPWTLSSDTVWRKTHRAGGFVFLLGGCALLIEGITPLGNVLPVMIGTIVVTALTPVVQSYLLWKGEQGDRA